MNKPESLCLAPWVHTYLSPQTERRMCCASREPAQNFQQYIDTASGTGKYIPITLEEHWNSEHMRSVRLRMLAGETLPECEVCNNKLLNTDVYRDYFWHFFQNRYQEVIDSTDETGKTTMRPLSWDYRFSNLCNFKCRMCGDMLSSSWETEQRQNKMVNWSDPKNNWMIPDIKQEISKFQDQQVEAEFAQAVEEHRVEEIYWAGGEPLMYEQHWRYMQRIVELGDARRLYARYNTNLSRISYKNIDLFKDILSQVKGWQICASLDGTGKIGEYIRTGLDYKQWLNHLEQGLSYTSRSKLIRIDFTLTLPGMFEVDNIIQLSKQYGIGLLSKVIFSFSPDIILSPLALPRPILNRWLDEIQPGTYGAMYDVLQQLRTRPTFEEQWPNEYKDGLIKGKKRILEIEKIRQDQYTLDDILKERKDVYDWWKAIN